jgi:3-oxoacyl-[acyl-carrier protein] reductase
MKIEDARVLVTGGGTGIGRETARMMAARGAKVAVCGRREEPLREAAEEFGAVPIQADVSVEADVTRLVETVVRELGGYDVLVNNAAVGYFAPLLETGADAFRRVLDVNLIGAMLVGRESARHFVAHGGGHIVNVGSTAARKGFPGGSAYAASKFGLSALTECWRGELREHDVRVMQVNPSEVQTPFGRRPERRTINPSKLRSEEVAHVIVAMLEMDDRGFITEAAIWATNPR